MRFKKMFVALTVGIAALSLAACGGTASTTSNAPKVTRVLKLAHNQTETRPTHLALKEMSASLQSATSNGYSITISPDSALGAEAEYLQMVRPASSTWPSFQAPGWWPSMVTSWC